MEKSIFHMHGNYFCAINSPSGQTAVDSTGLEPERLHKRYFLRVICLPGFKVLTVPIRYGPRSRAKASVRPAGAH